MTLLEPDVALTDCGLAIECAVLAWLVYRHRPTPNALRFWFVCFFAASGLGALLGGAAHGFIADKQSIAHTIVWAGTLIAIGLAAVAGWAAGANMLFDEHFARRIVRAAVAVYIAYVAVVVFIRDEFFVAIIHYLPAAVFLLIAFLVAYGRQRRSMLWVGALGMALTFVAAGVQQTGIGLHPHYFNHNALYHLIQAVALIFIYRGARSFHEQ